MVLARAERGARRGARHQRGTEERCRCGSSRAGDLRALATAGRSRHAGADHGGGGPGPLARTAKTGRVLAVPVGDGFGPGVPGEGAGPHAVKSTVALLRRARSGPVVYDGATTWDRIQTRSGCTARKLLRL